MSLKIAPALTLPLEAATETFGFLAVRGAGKSNAARVLAEEMFGAGVPFVAVDPVGSWYGLRSSRDGRSPGLPIPIFGGKHGDVPLEKGGGNLLADVVVDQRLSCVLDLSQFDSEASKKTFLLDFARRLYQRNEEPLHLFLEESDDYIPQRPMRDEAQLLRAWENIVRRGRGRGLGITLITQRSASLNKSVLTQVQTLIAMRTTGPQDRAAIEDWLKYHAQSREILESLPGLEDGEAWVWSPRFLKETKRIRFRLSTTLDSGRTPKLGQAKKSPATLADVDLVEVQRKMAATIERAKATDPKELRARIAQLERELAAKPKPVEVKPERVEVPVLGKEDFAALNHCISALKSEFNLVTAVLGDVAAALGKVGRNGHASRPLTEIRPRMRSENRKPPSPAPRSEASGELGKGERRILTAIAQRRAGASRQELTILTGYKRSSRDTYLQRLRQNGYVDDAGGQLTITDAGLEALGPDVEQLPTGDELREHWLRKLPAGERTVLEAVVAAYPKAVRRDELELDYQRSSRDTYLQRLSARNLIETPGPGLVRASEELFG